MTRHLSTLEPVAHRQVVRHAPGKQQCKDQAALPSLGISHSGCMSIPSLRQMTNDGKRKSFSRFPSSSGNIHVSILFHQNMPHSLNHVRDRQIRELRNKNRKKGYFFPLFRFNRFYFTPPILFCQYIFSCYTNFSSCSHYFCVFYIYYRKQPVSQPDTDTPGIYPAACVTVFTDRSAGESKKLLFCRPQCWSFAGAAFV